MEDRYKIFNWLMIIPSVITIFTMFFLPDKMPMHYNSSGIVDSYGSKDIYVIIPICIIALGFFLKTVSKNDKTNSREFSYYISFGTLLYFNLMDFLFLYKGCYISKKIKGLVNIDINQGLLYCGIISITVMLTYWLFMKFNHKTNKI